jgi:hypothetical protein
MAFKNSFLWVLGLCASLCVVSCSGPTSPPPPAGSPVADREAVYGLADSVANSTEEFDCTHLETVNVRFSSPGWVDENRVGLYALYEAAPAGEKLLRVWWDNEKHPTDYQDISLGEGDRRDDQRFDVEQVVEHVYAPVAQPETVLVRTEFILSGKTGNCPRNRRITLEPKREDPVDAGGSPQPPKQETCASFRFCSLGDGTVRDNTTGLVWLRNPGCFVPQRWQDAVNGVAAISSGHCGLTDGSLPGSWRLPTVEELRSLLDPRFVDPSLSNGRGDAQWSSGDSFTGVTPVSYWTSETVENCLGQFPGASIVSLGNGAVRCRPISLGALFWPVRAQ